MLFYRSAYAGENDWTISAAFRQSLYAWYSITLCRCKLLTETSVLGLNHAWIFLKHVIPPLCFFTTNTILYLQTSTIKEISWHSPKSDRGRRGQRMHVWMIWFSKPFARLTYALDLVCYDSTQSTQSVISGDWSKLIPSSFLFFHHIHLFFFNMAKSLMIWIQPRSS